MDKVIAIVGPTASGKTALSVELAKRLDGEIINGDSVQVYRGLSIGTAKITEAEMQGVPHHLLDIKDPEEEFSVADYQKLVREKISEIASRGKLPIIVGGTGLYVQAVLFDYRFPEHKTDAALRGSLEKQLEERGPAYMHGQLLKLNPAADIHPNNTRRVLRALEILMSGGEQPSGERALVPLYEELIIGLDMPRAELYERINLRVDRMMEQGLLGEVESLHQSGLRGVQSVQAIGYKELYAFLDGDIPLEEALSQLKQNSRRYAKRQLTYFRNKLPVHWLDGRSPAEENVQNIMRLLQENAGLRRNV